MKSVQTLPNSLNIVSFDHPVGFVPNISVNMRNFNEIK